MKINTSISELSSVLSDLLKGLDIDTKIQEHTCIVLWDEIVGDRIAGSTQPNFVRDGLLFVTTKSPVWANELCLYKRDIIQKINNRLGGMVIKDIIFKSGRLVKKRALKTKLEEDKLNIEGIALSDDEIQKIDAISSEAGSELSVSMKEMLLTAARLEKWKKAKGWKPCKRCGVLQGTHTDLCPVCSIKPK